MKSDTKYKQKLLHLLENDPFSRDNTTSVLSLLRNNNFLLYGSGDGFITFSVFILNKYGLKPNAILDRRFKSGDIFMGIPAFPPNEYSPTEEEKKDSVVVVTVGKTEYHYEIFNDLRKLGFKNILLANDIYEYHLHYAPPEVEEKGYKYFLENKDNILHCLDILADNLSRRILYHLIRTHMLRQPIPIPNRPVDEQYFPLDINLSKGYLRVINCGAYNGDMVRRLNKRFGKVDAIACFEPDSGNFQLLVDYLVKKHDQIASSIIAFPCGVFSHECQLRFASSNKTNSSISDKGESIIQCVALDHVLPNFRPTFLQMDIEGAVLAAITGSENLIREYKPDLAICVYHTPSHIWEIPLYINSLNLNYRFYLRNYTSFVSETVFYATT